MWSLTLPLRFGGVVATVALLASTATSASVARESAVDPGTSVNGMIVVQGVARDAQVGLFADGYCNPVVLNPGRRTRSCHGLPAVRRVFVGHGIFAPRKRIDELWRARTWGMWIDGERVTLNRFGHSDRWLLNYPPAGGRNVVLREWAIVLTGAEGRHRIRYRTSLPQGITDTTWRFTVGRG